MTTRASSGHGTLALRVAGDRERRTTTLPTHVFVTVADRQHPGVLVEWVRGPSNQWFGRVMWADPDGGVHIEVLPSDSIRRLLKNGPSTGSAAGSPPAPLASS